MLQHQQQIQVLLAKSASKLHHSDLISAAYKAPAFPTEAAVLQAQTRFIEATGRQLFQEYALSRPKDLDQSIKAQAAAQVGLDAKRAKIEKVELDIHALAIKVVQERSLFEESQQALKASVANLNELKSNAPEGVFPDPALKEAELAKIEQQVLAAMAQLASDRETAEKLKADLTRASIEAEHRMTQQEAILALERPRREQLKIMREFCRSKAMLLAELSGFSLLLDENGAGWFLFFCATVLEEEEIEETNQKKSV